MFRTSTLIAVTLILAASALCPGVVAGPLDDDFHDFFGRDRRRIDREIPTEDESDDDRTVVPPPSNDDIDESRRRRRRPVDKGEPEENKPSRDRPGVPGLLKDGTYEIWGRNARLVGKEDRIKLTFGGDEPEEVGDMLVHESMHKGDGGTWLDFQLELKPGVSGFAGNPFGMSEMWFVNFDFKNPNTKAGGFYLYYTKDGEPVSLATPNRPHGWIAEHPFEKDIEVWTGEPTPLPPESSEFRNAVVSGMQYAWIHSDRGGLGVPADANGVHVGFLAVPEPSSMVLAALGACSLGMLCFGRRRGARLSAESGSPARLTGRLANASRAAGKWWVRSVNLLRK